MKVRNLRDRLTSLEALIASETGDTEVALKKLSGLYDPESLRRRISLLLNSNRFDEAYSITKSYAPHCEWVEVGIRAAVLVRDIQMATQLVEKSIALEDSTGTLHLRCVVSFASSVFSKQILSSSDESHIVSIYAVEEYLQSALSISVEFLIPHCEAIYERRVISSPLENEAVSILQIALGLLGRGEESKRYLPFLLCNLQ